MPDSEYEAEGFLWFAQHLDQLPASTPRWMRQVCEYPGDFPRMRKQGLLYGGKEVLWVVRWRFA